MSGLRRVFFAALAALFNAFAWLPLFIGQGCATLADICEDLAR